MKKPILLTTGLCLALFVLMWSFSHFNSNSFVDTHDVASVIPTDQDVLPKAKRSKAISQSQPSVDTSETSIQAEKEMSDYELQLSKLTYVNDKDLQTISKERILQKYDLDNLQIENDYLTLGQNTRVTLENLFYSLPIDEIKNNKKKLTEAVTDKYGKNVGNSFGQLLEEFTNYFISLNELDDYRNKNNIKPEDVPDILTTKTELQEKSFGIEKSASLFSVERQTLAVMSRQKERYRDRTEPLSKEELDAIQREYEAIQ